MQARSGAGRAADLVALLVVTTWGINFVFMKAAFAEFDVLAFTFLRFAGMLVLGWGVVLCYARRDGGRERIAVLRADLPPLLLAGVLGFSLYMLLAAVGLDSTTAFSNALVLALAPLFMALLLWLLGQEVIGGWQWAAMLAALVGVVIFLLGRAGAGPIVGAGDLINLAAAISYAGYVVVNRPLAGRYPAPVLTTYTLTAGALPVLLLTLPALLAQEWGRVTFAGWATLLWATIFPVYVAWTLWSWVNARAGVSRTSIFLYLVPVISGVTGWLVLAEGFGVQQVLGALLVLIGLVLSRRTVRTPVTPPEAALPPGTATLPVEWPAGQSPATTPRSSTLSGGIPAPLLDGGAPDDEHGPAPVGVQRASD